MTHLGRNILVFSVLLTAVACGSDDSDDGGGSSAVKSGVATDKQLGMLTQADVDQIGKSYAATVGSPAVVEAMCNVAGVFASAFAGAAGGDMPAPSCEQTVADCKQAAASDPVAAGASAGVTSVPNTTTAFASCAVTVGELEACLTESVKLITDTFGSIKCGDDISKLGEGAGEAPMACANLSAMCPGVMTSTAN